VLYIYLSVSNSFLRDDANWVPQTHANVRVRRPSQDSNYAPVPRMTDVPVRQACFGHDGIICRGAY
jgi:hypothetical protein